MVEFSDDELAQALPQEIGTTDKLSKEEKRKLVASLVKGNVDPAPDIQDPEPPEPVTVKLRELKADELPIIGEHYVVWGSKLLNDIRQRPVTRIAPLTENQYANTQANAAALLTKHGTKDPPGGSTYPPNRETRAETYARWRYQGYLCGQIKTL